MLRRKSRQQEQGFTLVEVIVAILIATVFVSITMQAMVMAVILKARAKEYSEAINWVQQDLEQAKHRASRYKITTASGAALGATSITVASSAGFAVNDTILVGIDAQSYTITQVSGNTLTISPALNNTTPNVYGPNLLVVNNTFCNAPNSSSGFGQYFVNELNASQVINPSTKTFSTGRQFTITRNPIAVNAIPYNRLRIDYDVKSTQGGLSVAKMNAEIIPDAALRCP